MQTRTIYFDYHKSISQLLFGIAVICSILFFDGFSFWSFSIIIIGGSLIYFSMKSLSKKPQLIFSEQGLFIGYRVNKLIPLKRIDRLVIKEKSVDFRTMAFIKVTSRINTDAPSNKLVRDFPIDNLKCSKDELKLIIAKFMEYQRS